ncbi:ABC transporter permease [Parablautia sp. Marseille-Q6255]|uniref:ABC transporter permease n=1 Tax=Parablautia sp. Marseille-Q6255 TaxID=3039593 RepID=UPI0024BC9BB8|nr:FtsX-like permease family protein [Parablautia sp. Marseille-Q6255]
MSIRYQLRRLSGKLFRCGKYAAEDGTDEMGRIKMKKKALRKDFRMEIKKSLNRFLSIFFIVALGVAFFSGIQTAAPSMRMTGDKYFDDSDLMDIRVMSTLGLTAEDLEELQTVEGVEAVSGCYSEDVYCGEGDTRQVLHVESVAADMNQLALMEGELPKRAGECFLDSEYAKQMGYEPGDVLEISVSDEENSSLKRRRFTITGTGYSPTYISYERGSTTLGTGSLSGFVYVLPEDFDMDIYTVAYLLADGAREQTAFTDGYDQAVDEVLSRIEAIADARCEIRYEEVMQEAQSELDDARKEVEDGKQELADAKRELADGQAEAQSELDEAQSELIDGQEQLGDGKKDWYEANREAADGERALADGEQELLDNEGTIAEAQQQLDQGYQELSDGEKEYQTGLAQYKKEAKKGNKQLAAAQKKIDDGKTELAVGWQTYYTNLTNIETGEKQLAQAEETLSAQQEQYDAGASLLAQGKAQYEEAAKQLPALQASYDELEAQVDALTSQQADTQGQLDALQGAYDEAAANAAALRAQQQEALSRRDGYQADYDAKAGEKLAAQGEMEAKQQELAGWQAVLNSDTATPEEKVVAQEQVDRLTQEIAQLHDTVDSLQGEMDALQGNIAAEQSNADQAGTQAQKIEAGLPEQEMAIAAARTALSQIEAGLSQAQEGAAQLKQSIDTLAATKKTLDQKEAELASASAQLEAGWKELSKKQKELAAGRTKLEQGEKTLEATQKQLDEAQEQVDQGRKELKNAKKELKAARTQLDTGWAQLEVSKNQLADGKRQLEDGRSQLADARQTLADARAQIADGHRELAENKQKIKDGWKDYEDGKADAQREIAEGEQKIEEAELDLADAQQQISDAQQELDDLKLPEWYVEDRSVLPEHSGFGENAERMANLAKVIPVLFFLVAALISLTTMTRMVEEERTQIGTLKALGYGKWEIASKYLKYAFWATIGGSVIGVLVGEKLLPWVIINAYGIIYIYLPEILIPYNWGFALVSTVAALICTIGATFSACYRELRAVPAQLMRPPAPKEGKRVLLERLPFLWKHLSFSWKSTVRNLIRYKKRFLMTIFGIGGCMGLLLVGYGLQDSIMDIGILQFEDLQMYDAITILDADASEADLAVPDQMVTEDERISESKHFYMKQEEIDTTGISDKEWSVYVYVPEDLENLEEFLCFRDRETKEIYELTDEGAIITEKIANELGIQPGDVIRLKQDDGEDIEVPILAVCENYLSHYLYMTPALYERVYGETPQYNSIFWKSPQEQSVIEKIGEELLAQDTVLNITYTRTMAGQIDSMIGAMDIVMVVLIVSAGMLAFVVLYNLNNININERRRELATLKVLGFYDGEVAAYVYRENVLLTIIGAVLGCVIGKLLHAYVITTVEVDMCMFGRNINPQSFIYGTLFTIGFSVIVNYAMYFKLKKIDMVESLKSIE